MRTARGPSCSAGTSAQNSSASGTDPPSRAGPRPVTGSVLRLQRLDRSESLPPFDAMLTRLDDVERSRAARHRRPADATGFVAGRYLLRLLAADLLDTDPSALRTDFSCPACGGSGITSDHGRPGYTLDGARVPLALSLSRTASAVLVGALDLRIDGPRAVADGRTGCLGVDLEAAGSVVFDSFDEVALTPAEQRRLTALPPEERNLERARLWVRKEALMKARGTGFASEGPSSVDVIEDVDATSGARIVDLDQCDGVLLGDLGLVAAVAVVRS